MYESPNRMKFQTGDDGMRGEPYKPFLPYIKKHPAVSLFFEGVSDTDSSRGWFCAVFEKGEKSREEHQSFSFGDYEDEEECFKARDASREEQNEPELLQWLGGFSSPEDCLNSIQQNGMAIHYVQESMRSPLLYQSAVHQGVSLTQVPEEMRTLEVCVEAVQYCKKDDFRLGSVLEEIPGTLQEQVKKAAGLED